MSKNMLAMSFKIPTAPGIPRYHSLPIFPWTPFGPIWSGTNVYENYIENLCKLLEN